MIQIQSNAKDLKRFMTNLTVQIKRSSGLFSKELTEQGKRNVKHNMSKFRWRGNTEKKVIAKHFPKNAKGIIQMMDPESDMIAYDNETNAGGVRKLSKKANPLLAEWAEEKGIFTNLSFVVVGGKGTRKAKSPHTAFADGFGMLIKQTPRIIENEISKLAQRVK